MIKNSLDSVRPKEEELNGIYRGVVEDNSSDPEKSGRCKIRVFNIHTQRKIKTKTEGIPTEELPWAEPVMGLFEGSVTGFGSWTVPLQGSHVFVFFENGNIMQPRYFATVPGIPSDQYHGYAGPPKEGFSDPNEEFPNKETQFPHRPNQLNEPDFHRLGRNERTNETIVKHKKDNKDKGISIALDGTWDEPDPYYAAEYPNNKVFSTSSGITIEIDDTEGEERIHCYHPSKTYIEINKDGSMVVRNAKDKFEIVDNDKKEHVMNNYDRTVDTDRTSKVGNNEDEEIGNNRTREIGNNNDDTIGNNETISIGNNKDDTVGNNETRNIGTNLTESVGSVTDRSAGSLYKVSAPTILLN